MLSRISRKAAVKVTAYSNSSSSFSILAGRAWTPSPSTSLPMMMMMMTTTMVGTRSRGHALIGNDEMAIGWNRHGKRITMHRSFHASCPVRLAVRRRRRGQQQAIVPDNDNDDDENDKEESQSLASQQPTRRVLDPVHFGSCATRLLDKIYAALAPLRAINDPFVLTRDRDDTGDYGNGECILLDLGPLHGQYTLQVDPEQAMVHLNSPISGVVQYQCRVESDNIDESPHEWRSVTDGHILEGLLVRDLIRQIQGVPKF